METLVSGLLTIFAGLIAIPTAVFFLEIIAAITLARRATGAALSRGSRRRVAVLVPAHNENTGLLPTLADIKSQLHAGDSLLVVADNCSDNTAAVAAAAGAEVVERNDPERIGKGYALDFGLRHLRRDPPDIVVMVDADCRLALDAIDQLASACATTGRPVQALYLMTAPDEWQIKHRVAEFAWRVKNWVRPLGLHALDLPCLLTGAGMAFPWEAIRSADLASGWIVEDMKLGLDLAAAGHPPLFCPSAQVTSQFAASFEGATIQRKRWEQGHIGTILRSGPHLLSVAVARHDLGLLALTLDLAVPPLSLLTMLLIVTFMIAGVAVLSGLSSVPLIISSACVVGFVIAVFLAWSTHARDILPPRAILSMPGYAVGKLDIYRQMLFGKTTTQWIRTDRTKS